MSLTRSMMNMAFVPHATKAAGTNSSLWLNFRNWKWAKLIPTIVVWYTTNAAFAVFAKRAVRHPPDQQFNGFDDPVAAELHRIEPIARSLDLSLLQCIVGSLFGLLVWGWVSIAKGRPVFRDVKHGGPPSCSTLSIVSVGLFHLAGGVLTNAGFALQSASLTQILKASEPIITVTLSFLLHNKVHPPSTYIAVVLITVGICLCSATDITFNYVGTAITLASSICLPLRNIYGKQVNTAVGGSMNMFIIATWVASAAWLPIYLMLRLGIYSNVPFSLSSNNGQDVNMDVWVAAACHVSYNLASFTVLGLVAEVATHAIANVIKRLFSIVASMIYFEVTLTPMTLSGLGIVALGMYFYEQGKMQGLSNTGLGSPKSKRLANYILSVVGFGTVYLLSATVSVANHHPQPLHVQLLRISPELDQNSTGVYEHKVMASEIAYQISKNKPEDRNHLPLSESCFLPLINVTHTNRRHRLGKQAGAPCDDQDPNTFLDVCDGAGVCSGTPKASPDLPPYSTNWYQGPKLKGLRSMITSAGADEFFAPLLKDGTRNFGDEIGPLVLNWMSGREVVRNTENPDFIVVGSVMDFVTRHFVPSAEHPNVTFWGPGTKYFADSAWNIITSKENKVRCLDYRAFRGPLTRKMCLIAGCNCPPVYGDPAMLLPLFFRPQPQPKKGQQLSACVIPHINDYELPGGAMQLWLRQTKLPYASGQSRGKDIFYYAPYGEHDAEIDGSIIRFIDIRTDNHETFIQSMVSCPWIASVSLHGLILAEAYGIPWRWIKFTGGREPELKYQDFFLSVGIPLHSEFTKPVEIGVFKDVTELLDLRPPPIHLTNGVRGTSLIDIRALVEACPFAHENVTNRLYRSVDSVEGARVRTLQSVSFPSKNNTPPM